MPGDDRRVRAVLLDRDGVLNRPAPGGYLTHESGWQWLPGTLEACRDLALKGYRVAVVTNQSAIARSWLTTAGLDRIHERMHADLAAAGAGRWPVFHCPHHPEDGCDCRKPQPGMLRRAMTALGVAPSETVMIGDHETDLQAAANAGCSAIHVRCGRTRNLPPAVACLASVADLAAAVRLLTGSDMSDRSTHV
jgi:D-glycero-D-manno-heptose 1,7-bisphosphate phosphatase